jgi:hypothetical protein
MVIWDYLVEHRRRMRVIQNAVGVIATTFALVSFVAAAQTESPTLPRVSAGIAQLAKLQEAGVTEEVLLAYVQNSWVPKPNAEEVIYLHERGVSGSVMATLLKRKDVLVTPPAAPAYEQVAATSEAAPAQPAASQPIIVPSEPVAAQSPTVIHIGSSGYTPRYNESYFAPYFGMPYPGSFYNTPAYLSPIYTVSPGFSRFGHHWAGHHFGRNHGDHWTGHHAGRDHGQHWSGHPHRR